jgi:TolA-binding protein
MRAVRLAIALAPLLLAAASLGGCASSPPVPERAGAAAVVTPVRAVAGEAALPAVSAEAKPVLAAADEVFESSRKLYEQKAFKPAKEGFAAYRKAVAGLPPTWTAHVADSLYLEAECEYAAGEKARAHDLYLAILEEHANYARIADVVAREYEIGLSFIEGKAERPILFFHVTSESLGADILERLLASYQQKYFDYAQFQLGEYYLRRRELRRAADAFALVEEGYRESPWAGAAQVRRAACYLGQSRGAEYDPTPIAKAEETLLDYLRRNPTGSRVQEAEEMLRGIREARAAHYADLSRFYLFRERRPRAALVYVEALVRELPGTAAAGRAPGLLDDVIAMAEEDDPATATAARERGIELARSGAPASPGGGAPEGAAGAGGAGPGAPKAPVSPPAAGGGSGDGSRRDARSGSYGR